MKTLLAVCIAFPILVVTTASCEDLPALFSCDDETLQEVKSPNGGFVATVFVRDCGATTDFSTLLSLRKAGQAFSPDKDDQGIQTSFEGRHEVKIRWLSARKLEVVLPKARPVKRHNRWQAITITYKEQEH